MVRRALEALATPVAQRTPQQVRLLIGQQEDCPRLVPIALGWLADDPLLEVDFYPGDLLVAVCRLPAAFWSAHPDELAELDHLLATTAADLTDAPLPEAVAAFRTLITTAG